MLRGLQVPLQVSPYGSAKVVEGPSVVGQNIILAVMPSGNRNPWSQNLSPDESLVFDIADDMVVGGSLSRHIREVLDQMERRGYAKLLPGNRGVRVKSRGSEMFVFVRYINLENDKTETIRIPVR
jgi:hypothetical protein